MGILDNAKDIARLIEKYNDINLYRKIVDLRDEIIELKDENIKLKEKTHNIEQAKEIENCLSWESPCYFLIKEGKKDGPFCQKCYDLDKKLIRLQYHKNGQWECLVCSKWFNDSSYCPPKPMSTKYNDL